MAGVTSIWDIPSVAADANAGAGGGYTSNGVPRRPSVYSEGIYHEQQEGMMCAMHAINNLLQARTFDEVSLASIARSLDEEEWKAAGRLQGEHGTSNNVRADGYFGIQVIQNAIQSVGLTMTPLASAQAAAARADPSTCQGFIVNHGDHWFAVRRIGTHWFDLNSTQAAPQYVSPTYISMFLTQLQQTGSTVFVVEGVYPPVALSSDARALAKAVEAHSNKSDARTWTNGQASAANAGGVTAFSGTGHSLRASANTQHIGGGGGGEDAELAAAIAASLSDSGGPAAAGPANATMAASSMGDASARADDADLAAAIAASLQGSAAHPTASLPPVQSAAATGDDAELAAAIAASMAGAGVSAESTAPPAPSSGQISQEEMRRRRLARFG